MYKSLRAQTLHYFARPHEGVRRESIDAPSAWRGEDMRQRDDWIVKLDTAQVEELKNAVTMAKSSGKPMGQMTQADFPLPRLAPRINEWRREIRRGRGFVLVRGAPVQDWSGEEAELFFWCLGLHLGLPGAQNPQGHLLGHVRDERSDEDVRYYRTNLNIAVHTDAADVVGLLCLQPAKRGGLSRIASSVAVYNELLHRKPHLVERLYEPLYFDTHGDGGVPAFPIAPCRYAGGELRTFWQSDYFRSAPRVDYVPQLTDEERELLDSYQEIAESPEFYLDMDFQPGDVQLLSNHSILHARTGYEDWPEPERRRHLLRLWISLPEKKSLRTRWLTTKAWAGLLYTATRELALHGRAVRSNQSPLNSA